MRVVDHMPNMMDLELLEKDLKKASTDSGTPCMKEPCC